MVTVFQQPRSVEYRPLKFEAVQVKDIANNFNELKETNIEWVRGAIEKGIILYVREGDATYLVVRGPAAGDQVSVGDWLIHSPRTGHIHVFDDESYRAMFREDN